ncbi:hypothetical protein CC78DRAFT_514854 [Lojkania enalia]|uniref:Uncharacterized protein n=1 Tax=Lojkania enalia TaxID=147567 RepID=A0A9P4N8P4_9PLEO|nr:hypothetical protein CC78DRAFT_514854 [Didymosphaeria enalia]
MPTDPHQGGRLEDMAPTGTSVPNDAGKYNTLPSVPRPDQVDPSPVDFSHANPAHAADNTFDIPRGTKDRGITGEVMTGIGDQLTSNIEKKRLDDASYDPRAHGHQQYAKHARQHQPDNMVHGDHNVQAAPGEELDNQDALLDRRGAK